jgi:16S rRNA (guanine527-N7)-methyltransferase
MPLDPEFKAALDSRSIELEPEVAEKLEEYVRTMWQLNEQLNLTRHTTWDLFVGRDLRDCIHLAPLLEPEELVLDLGSGNGIPGIPLAILRPDLDVSLAESVAKRAGALNEIVAAIDVPVAVYAARGEDLLEDFRFSTIVSRAVGSIAKFCRWIEPHWSNVDRLLLIKGPKWVEERGEARHVGVLKNLQLRRVAGYPLGDAVAQDAAAQETEEGDSISSVESSEGVILQIWRAGTAGDRFNRQPE